jgi:hypothetical protein
VGKIDANDTISGHACAGVVIVGTGLLRRAKIVAVSALIVAVSALIVALSAAIVLL